MRRTTSLLSLWRGRVEHRGAAAALGLCAVAGLCGTAAAAEGESRVRSVVIYPDRAQVTRAREVECGERVAAVQRHASASLALRRRARTCSAQAANRVSVSVSSSSASCAESPRSPLARTTPSMK